MTFRVIVVYIFRALRSSCETNQFLKNRKRLVIRLILEILNGLGVFVFNVRTLEHLVVLAAACDRHEQQRTNSE